MFSSEPGGLVLCPEEGLFPWDSARSSTSFAIHTYISFQQAGQRNAALAKCRVMSAKRCVREMTCSLSEQCLKRTTYQVISSILVISTSFYCSKVCLKKAICIISWHCTCRITETFFWIYQCYIRYSQKNKGIQNFHQDVKAKYFNFFKRCKNSCWWVLIYISTTSRLEGSPKMLYWSPVFVWVFP